MMEDTSKQEASEVEEDAEEGEPEEGHKEGQHVEEPRAQAAPPRREGGGWLSKLIWLIILALIVWGGWTAYKRGNADAPETQPEESVPAAPATTTP